MKRYPVRPQIAVGLYSASVAASRAKRVVGSRIAVGEIPITRYQENIARAHDIHFTSIHVPNQIHLPDLMILTVFEEFTSSLEFRLLPYHHLSRLPCRRSTVNVSKQVLLSFVASALLVAPAWARLAPTAVPVQSQPSPSQPTPVTAATATVSGKIAAATDSSLSLEVQNGSDPQTEQFVINSDTKVDGKLAVGSIATVEYRTDGGANIATHITVQSGS
jgi:hypothetical protein